MYGYPVRDEIFDKIKAFLKEIDKPGAILAVYDEGKIFARNELLNYQKIYGKMLHYIFTDTQHIKIRVGGYSHRVATMVYHIIEKEPSYKERVEYVGEKVSKIIFDKESDFVKGADEYDFKGFDGHSCVYYYVNGIDSGFTDKDGNFQEFYGARNKGFDALVEVVMAIGYGDILPATAAVHTFSSDSSGDMLICGGKPTKKKCRGQSRQDLFEEYNIPYLDIYKILPSFDDLNEDLEKEKKERHRIWLEEYVVTRKEGDYCIVTNQGKYYFKNGDEFLKTPGGVVVKTIYWQIADRILEDWINKGYDSYTDPTSILSYHFTCQENFAPMKHSEVVEMLNGLNWEYNWTFDNCPSPDPNVWMQWKSLLGEPSERILQIKNWFNKCTHMQLVAATCVYNACYSYNMAYLMATAVEKIEKPTEQIENIRAIASFLSNFDPEFDPDYMVEIFNAFSLYYTQHFREDGAKIE